MVGKKTSRATLKTTHNLMFLSGPWRPKGWVRLFRWIAKLVTKNDDQHPEIEWSVFRVGTCEGLWRETPEAYEILSIVNTEPGNGHLEDVFEKFGYACRFKKKPLRILSFTNKRFKEHLLTEQSFHPFGDDLEKEFH